MIERISASTADCFMLENRVRDLGIHAKSDQMYGYYIDGLLVGIGGIRGRTIVSLLVRKDYRCRGVGTSIVRYLMNLGGDNCFATVDSEPIFAKYGFVVTKSYKISKRMKKA